MDKFALRRFNLLEIGFFYRFQDAFTPLLSKNKGKIPNGDCVGVLIAKYWEEGILVVVFVDEDKLELTGSDPVTGEGYGLSEDDLVELFISDDTGLIISPYHPEVEKDRLRRQRERKKEED